GSPEQVGSYHLLLPLLRYHLQENTSSLALERMRVFPCFRVDDGFSIRLDGFLGGYGDARWVWEQGKCEPQQTEQAYNKADYGCSGLSTGDELSPDTCLLRRFVFFPDGFSPNSFGFPRFAGRFCFFGRFRD